MGEAPEQVERANDDPRLEGLKGHPAQDPEHIGQTCETMKSPAMLACTEGWVLSGRDFLGKCVAHASTSPMSTTLALC